MPFRQLVFEDAMAARLIARRIAVIINLALGVIIAPLAVEAQHPVTIPKIGYLTPSSPSSGTSSINAFRNELREHGYIDGTNVVIEPRFADGYERVPALLAELLSLNVDVLVVATTPVALAAQRATTTVPIVFAPVADPVRSGLVASLARPGGNITGWSDIAAGLIQKRLALLKELVPRTTRVGVLRHADNPTGSNELESAAGQLGLELYNADVRNTADLEPAFAVLMKARVHSLIAVADVHLNQHATALARLATIRRLSLMGFSASWAKAGALLSYGAAYGAGTLLESQRRAADYVAKILRGAKPGDLPVQQPTKFELVINLRTAKALGMTIPRSVLLQADQVIE